MNGLEDILNDEPIASEPEAVEEKAETPQPARDEHGRFAPKGEEESASPAPVEEKPTLEHPALIGERRRRQEAEARAAELEARLNSQPAPQLADIWENTQEWQSQFRDQILSEAEQRALARFEERNIARSATAARSKYQDFDDVIGTFSDLARQNPLLERQLRDADNPGEFAYTTAKTHMELQQYGGDVNALVAARVKAELEKARPKDSEPSVEIPESLAGAQSARGTTAPTPSSFSLDDILRGK